MHRKAGRIAELLKDISSLLKPSSDEDSLPRLVDAASMHAEVLEALDVTPDSDLEEVKSASQLGRKLAEQLQEHLQPLADRYVEAHAQFECSEVRKNKLAAAIRLAATLSNEPRIELRAPKQGAAICVRLESKQSIPRPNTPERNTLDALVREHPDLLARSSTVHAGKLASALNWIHQSNPSLASKVKALLKERQTRVIRVKHDRS